MTNKINKEISCMDDFDKNSITTDQALKKIFNAISPIDENEIIPNTTFNNPIKHFYFKYIKRQNPYSLEAVSDLLNKFKNNIHLIKGNSNNLLKKMDMKKIDFVFLDGGHHYDTVMNDLNYSKDVILNNGTVYCDDYDLEYAPGVKKAIDEFVENNNFQKKILLNNRFALI